MRTAALIAVALVALSGCGKAAQEPQKPWMPKGLLPAVESFLLNTDHGLGTAISAGPCPPWAKGPRQVVSFAEGHTLLFYIEGDRVRSVYEQGEDGRRKVWGD